MGGERCQFELKGSWSVHRLRDLRICRLLRYGSIQGLKDLNRGRATVRLRNRPKVPIDWRYKSSGLRAGAGSNSPERTIMIRVELLEDIDRAASNGVEALAGDVELHVVNSFSDGQSLELFASVAVEDHDLAAAASHEQPLVLFIKTHGNIVFAHGEQPR